MCVCVCISLYFLVNIGAMCVLASVKCCAGVCLVPTCGLSWLQGGTRVWVLIVSQGSGAVNWDFTGWPGL